MGSCISPGIPGATPVFGTVPFTAPADAGGGLPQNTYNIVGRVDYNLNDKTQAFFRYVDYNEIDQIGSADATPYAQYNVGQSVKNQAYLLSASHVFTSHFLTSTKLSFSRFNTSNTYNTALQNTPTLLVSPNAQVPGTSRSSGCPVSMTKTPRMAASRSAVRKIPSSGTRI